MIDGALVSVQWMWTLHPASGRLIYDFKSDNGVQPAPLKAPPNNVQWGEKVFSQPPIVQVLPLKKMRGLSCSS